MKKSRLETYEEILGALVQKSLTIDAIAYETNIDCTTVKSRLDFLIRNGLVEERISHKKTRFAITERGVTVFKTLNFQKYLERVANTIRLMDDALQTIPAISQQLSEREKRT